MRVGDIIKMVLPCPNLDKWPANLNMGCPKGLTDDGKVDVYGLQYNVSDVGTLLNLLGFVPPKMSALISVMNFVPVCVQTLQRDTPDCVLERELGRQVMVRT